MNDINVQGSRAYATAYASNEVKIQSSSQSTAATTASTSTSDTVSISAEAKELFQQSSVAALAATLTVDTNNGQPAESTPSAGDTGNTTQSSGLGGRPDSPSTGTVSPFSSGLGGRPGG